MKLNEMLLVKKVSTSSVCISFIYEAVAVQYKLWLELLDFLILRLYVKESKNCDKN